MLLYLPMYASSHNYLFITFKYKLKESLQTMLSLDFLSIIPIRLLCLNFYPDLLRFRYIFFESKSYTSLRPIGRDRFSPWVFGDLTMPAKAPPVVV